MGIHGDTRREARLATMNRVSRYSPGYITAWNPSLKKTRKLG